MGTVVGPENTLACLSCHKLHESPTPGKLLADTLSQSKLCLRCHEDRGGIVGTQHDLRKSEPTTRNALNETADDSGPCSACHSPHKDARLPAPDHGDPSGECLTCHAPGRVGYKIFIRIMSHELICRPGFH